MRNRWKQGSLGIGIFLLGLIIMGHEGEVLASPAKAPTKQPSAVSESPKGGVKDKNLQKQIHDLDGQIKVLRKQSLELQEKTRAKLQAQLDALREQRDTLLPKIERLRDNSETAWQEVKENIQAAIEDLKKSMESIKPE